MQHEQPELADLDNCGSRQIRRPFPSVHVSANDVGRSKLAQPIDDLRFSNVSGVNDDIRSAQCANRLGAEESWVSEMIPNSPSRRMAPYAPPAASLAIGSFLERYTELSSGD